MPVTPIEDCKGKFCDHCNGPATHAYGSCWLCCDCHAAPGEGPRPKTLEQWAVLVERLNTGLEAVAADREALLAALVGVVAKAKETHAYWDKDQDSKVGKHLAALAGYLKNYSPEFTAVHEAIAKHIDPSA